jgi:hypothetical protein
MWGSIVDLGEVGIGHFSENFILGNKIGFIKKLFYNTLVRSFKPGGVPPDSEGALRG